MQRLLLILALVLASSNVANAAGLLIPTEPDLPPLAMLNHHVTVTVDNQVAITKVAQTFRNHTDRKLEATYVFPVPPGASVRDFAMWVNGRKVRGELLKADRAKQMYTSIVRQTKNPALLDYIGTDMLRLKIFPVPPGGDQKVEVSFTAIAKREHDLVQYVYPLKTDRGAASTLEDFRLKLTLKSQQPIGNIYSPSHEVAINQNGDHEAVVTYQQQGASLDRDFHLFYSHSGRDIGLTTLQHRPISAEDGYVMLLLSPRAELSKQQKVPRDIVFVLDTSGSMMEDKKMDQAKKAVRHCLGQLTEDDRFALISFATTVNRHRDSLSPATEQHVKRGMGWVADQYAGGGTAIHEALTAALEMRSDDEGRMFTVVFFTDGQPTIGETDVDKILADVGKQNSSNTRIFSLGLGDDLNAVFLDQLAEKTRAVSRYVRPQQNIETHVASFFNKIHHPVLANLKLKSTSDVQLSEVYPPQLPDLFHGDQLIVLARYQGTGHAAIVLDGKVGMHDKQFVYELDFPEQADSAEFVEELWARRKVGYLLDHIRINGEQSELVDEVVRLAKHYGITTPYTSYLIMPDVQIASAGRLSRWGANAPAALAGGGFGGGGAAGGDGAAKLGDLARRIQQQPGGFAGGRGRFEDRRFDQFERDEKAQADKPSSANASPAEEFARSKMKRAQELKSTLDRAYFNYRQGKLRDNQIRKQGVDLAISTNRLKNEQQVQATAVRRVNARNCLELGGVWIDDGFTTKTPTLAVQAQSDAYFRILERHPPMKEVFRLGNHVLWVTPSGTALVIEASTGAEKLDDRQIDALFRRA